MYCEADDAINARADKEHDNFLDWCDENDADPEDPNTYEEYQDAQSYAKDPYAYNGLRQSDFY